jgi:hypothetical protein
MYQGQGGVLWDAFVLLMLAAGPAQERRTRYGDKERLARVLATAMSANA